MAINESDIKHASDELFLDTADGARLNIVSSNIGLDRPKVGYSDDHWRAVVKAIALRPKLVRSIFIRLIEICMGPRTARVAVLAKTALAGDKSIFITDPSNFVQIGTLQVDPGLATAEILDYGFVNYATGEILLNTPLQFNHTQLLPLASGRLLADVLAGAVSLPLDDTSLFPTSGFPYPVLVGRGTPLEEVVLVSANTLLTNTLTVGPLANDHKGPHSSFLRATLTADAPAGRNFIVISPTNARRFPVGSYIRVDAGTVNDEVALIDTNDPVNGVLSFRHPLKNNHVTGDSVDLAQPGALVDTLSVGVAGTYWDIIETAPNVFTIFAPTAAFEALRRSDASWLHGGVQPPFGTTLAANANPGDLLLSLASTAGLPGAGMLLINGTQVVFYTLDPAVPGQVNLDGPLGNAYGFATVVQLFQVPWPGTLVEDGNIFVPPAIRPNHFVGYYLYDPAQYAPSGLTSLLTALTLPSARVAFPAPASHTCVEVDDVSLWPASPFTPFTARLGTDSGFQEDRTVIDRCLKKDATAILLNPALIGDHTITLTTSVPFPESDGAHIAGYRVEIAPGFGNHEIVTVAQNNRGTNVLTLLTPLQFNHFGGFETVRVLHDVLQFDPLGSPHAGPSINPTRLGHLIQPFTSELQIVNAASFPTNGGIVWLNFGWELLPARQRIVAFPAGNQVQLVSTADFPTSGYPYQVVVGEGTANEEKITVANNNTATNTLTLTAVPSLTHVLNDYVRFDPGDPETVAYQAKNGNNLVFTPPALLASKHVVGARVMLSPGFSDPALDGTGYPFRMPVDPLECLTMMFDLIRAAGVQVRVVTSR